MRQNLTTTPTAVANVTAGVTYTMQNRGAQPLYLQTATAAPTDPDAAFVIRAGQGGAMSRAATEEIYVWVGRDDFGTGAIVYDEAV